MSSPEQNYSNKMTRRFSIHYETALEGTELNKMNLRSLDNVYLVYFSKVSYLNKFTA